MLSVYAHVIGNVESYMYNSVSLQAGPNAHGHKRHPAFGALQCPHTFRIRYLCIEALLLEPTTSPVSSIPSGFVHPLAKLAIAVQG